MVRDLEELKRKVTNIQNEKVVENLQLPVEVLESVGIVKEYKRLKKGRGSRPLLESEILDAQSKCDNATACARHLGVSYRSYKKYATRFGIFKINPWGRGDRKHYWDPNKGKYPLNEILQGKHPNYPVFRLKDLLIRSGIKKAECEMCHREDRRITDGKMPLVVNFMDGDSKNRNIDNIKIYCYCCAFCYGRGYLRRRVGMYFNDPDRLQDADKKIPSRF